MKFLSAPVRSAATFLPSGDSLTMLAVGFAAKASREMRSGSAAWDSAGGLAARNIDTRAQAADRQNRLTSSPSPEPGDHNSGKDKKKPRRGRSGRGQIIGLAKR